MKKYNTNANTWIANAQKRLNDMQEARHKKLENERFHEEVMAMKTEYDALAARIKDAKA